MLAMAGTDARASVKLAYLKPSLASPQTIGATVAWAAAATDSNPGPLTFQFNVAPPGGAFATVKQFNAGTLSGSTWKALPFAWALTGSDGAYQVQVVATDFISGESASRTVPFTVASPASGGNPVVEPTQNPLVALFVAPPCDAGSTIRVSFQPQSGAVPASTTNWAPCQPPASPTFEIAGMYPRTAYSLYAQVSTDGNMVDGPAVGFTTGALPSNISFPAFRVGIAGSPSDPNQVLLHGLFDVRKNIQLPDVATDLSGRIVWYNYASDETHTSMLTRPLASGFLAIQFGPAWAPNVQQYQVLRQFDWAGNLVRETNTGIVQQQLRALGSPDAQPCQSIPSPPPVGAACLGIFHHDAIQTLPNGYTAALVDVEKIFPPGTQGDSSGLPVDIVGDMIVVLDRNWNAVWYWDAFDPADGGNGYPLLPVSRPAVLNEECSLGQPLCLILFLLGPGVAPEARDWLHSNSLYYWPGNGAPGDIVWSSRHQDWVSKIDYQDGAGTGDLLWRMGPSGDFFFVNTYNDPWPWFSHQHEAGIENGGAGPLTVMDNGNTRRSPPAGPHSSTGGVPGLGTTNCGPSDCDTRGMALTIDETNMQVTPVLSADLGVFSDAMGSAQLLDDGNYYFLAAIVPVGQADTGDDIQIQPAPGTPTGAQVMNIVGPSAYRTWQMPSLYSPPTT